MNDYIMQNEKNPIFISQQEKDWLRVLLTEREVSVIFEKKDGSERKMICTLSENLISSEKLPKGTGKPKNDEVLAVFDLENNGWRSFRWDSIKQINFSLNGE